MLIYESQTEEEKAKEESVEDNYVGFTKVDAKELGDIAKKIKSGQQLTDGELAKSRNKMAKYWKQLMVISKRRMAEREEAERLERIWVGRKRFEDSIETLRRCSEEGIACDYGICDECPVARGLQMRLT